MARSGERMTSERRLAALEKQRQALEYRKAGLDYRAIAERVGYKSVSSAHDAVRLALKQTLQEPADELRSIEVTRLDQMLLGLWPQATRGVPDAVDRVLKIMARRAALLGLDAPKKLDQRIEFGTTEAAAEVAAEFGVPVADVIAEAERILRTSAHS